MQKPNVVYRDETGEVQHRIMTEEEYEALIATGWTLDAKQSAPDVGAQSSTDAG